MPKWEHLTEEEKAEEVRAFAAGLEALMEPDEAMLDAMQVGTFKSAAKAKCMRIYDKRKWQAALRSVLGLRSDRDSPGATAKELDDD